MKRFLMFFWICTLLALNACGYDGFAGKYWDGNYEDESAIIVDNEEDAEVEPNRFVNVLASPLSTFGADVDTASYSIFRRAVTEARNNFGPLRTEEMLNYFRYDYPQPEEGAPFSVSAEMTPCPWNAQTKLLRIGLATRRIPAEERPASNLVFLVDVSGSMSGHDRLDLLKQGMLLLVDQMRPVDRISIVTYASSQKLILDGGTYDDRESIRRAINSLNAGGSTNGGSGIIMAYNVAQKHFVEGGNNRIILGTDGDLNVGITSPAELKKLVEQKRDAGIFLSVLGFGVGNLKDRNMTALAKNGNGNYSYIDTITEAQKVLVNEISETLFVAAKDVKFQIEFNPASVKGYRLIGYELRKLNDRDFNDDRKDSGDIGAGHQVTVLYEIVDIHSAYPIPDANIKNPKPSTVPGDAWFSLSIRYKSPESSISQLLTYPMDLTIWRDALSSDMIFASAIAQVAMILSKSEFVGSATLSSVLAQLQSVPDFTQDIYKNEFIQLVKKLPNLTGK
ncbi:MAG: VWA domain-containing protein [Proteobacteria bacterium]|nr:VWA domain-containing protein [Pseudomonadota bacterium]